MSRFEPWCEQAVGAGSTADERLVRTVRPRRCDLPLRDLNCTQPPLTRDGERASLGRDKRWQGEGMGMDRNDGMAAVARLASALTSHQSTPRAPHLSERRECTVELERNESGA